MGDTTTPNLGLVKPQVGASRSTWGNKWNANADDLDYFVAGVQAEVAILQGQVATLQSEVAALGAPGAPIGAIFPWPMFSSAPAGYLQCNGELHPIASFPALAQILGTHYGGDGVTNFGVPDLRGCVLAGVDQGTGRLGPISVPDVPGSVIGSPTVGLTEAQMPSHQHAGTTDFQGQHSHGYTSYTLPGGAGFAIGAGAQFLAVSSQTDPGGTHGHNMATDFRGGGQGHPNLQVSCLVWWLIRAI